jgi:hypothetical protein
MASTLLGRLVAIAVVEALAQGCLITDRVDFDEPENRPPILFNANGAGDPATDPRSDRVVFVDATGTENLSFTAFVRDFNTRDRLDARAFLDYDTNSGILTAPLVDEPAEPGDWTVTAVVSPRAFSRGCHLLEVDIIDDPSGWDSSSASTPNRATIEGVGKVTAAWLVLAHLGSEDRGSDISLASCPTTTAHSDSGTGQSQ